MGRIDQETVQRILDAADIVDVVSDFVSLRRRGANYIGLCPFHNERTPSFSVSKSKGICKCFSCGKGGSAVNFIMQLEQMSYQEALRYLAKKYNIEIHERELTDKEREVASEREALFAVNEFALNHFEHNLLETTEGVNIGLSYFYERGINEAMIKKFHLGYAADKRDDFLNEARRKGYRDENLVITGLVGRTDKGDLYDRFRGRVIYPVFSISGKVVAFGGRTLRTDKVGGKYVNSPESVIYSKSKELYGLYQAKPAIVKKNKCILVEGYMDVISMHQSGVENVVASSGTSLTEGQIRLIHRFTENVTVIYDSDAAGIKASLRGIDMLLSEGLNVKVLQLPEGDDPDSFAQTHSSSEVEAYLNEHELDFIKFKMNILLDGVGDDPIRWSQVTSDIVRSIAVIPDEIARNAYIKECCYALGVDERVLINEVGKSRLAIREQEFKRQQQQRTREANSSRNTSNDMPQASDNQLDSPAAAESSEPQQATEYVVSSSVRKNTGRSSLLKPYERQVIRYVLKYGMVPMCETSDENGQVSSVSVIDFVETEMARDDIKFITPSFERLFNKAASLRDRYMEDLVASNDKAMEKRAEAWRVGEERIRTEAVTMDDIMVREKRLVEECDKVMSDYLADFTTNYVERILSFSSDDEVRDLTVELVMDKHQLSKIHTKFAHVETELEQLPELLPRALFELKNAILLCDINDLQADLKHEYSQSNPDMGRIAEIMNDLERMLKLRAEFAKLMGERVVTPNVKI
ncbi:MAG: DNA primase [Muribaculaceae bacterium]|nr:DNA primase [Muribaculaceae bacterium]